MNSDPKPTVNTNRKPQSTSCGCLSTLLWWLSSFRRGGDECRMQLQAGHSQCVKVIMHSVWLHCGLGLNRHEHLLILYINLITPYRIAQRTRKVQ